MTHDIDLVHVVVAAEVEVALALAERMRNEIGTPYPPSVRMGAPTGSAA